MKQGKIVYSGKAKTVYETDSPDLFILEFRDDTSRYNGEKIEKLNRKGLVNNYFNAYIMQYLESAGIKTHFVERLTDTTSLVKRLDMIPIESVVRNRAAGGICKRLGLEEGASFKQQIFEFFYKNDKLGDPMVNDSHILTFDWATETEISCMQTLSFGVNEALEPVFSKAELELIDFKLEFGRLGDDLVLGDEFTPDGCRIWDKHTKEKLDKDRFRRDLGNVVESYEIVAQRLGITIPD
jgi:phosphoribosylaminoimidazole-succinocarboxamide synthase